MIRLALLALSCLAVGFSMSAHEHEWSPEELVPPGRGSAWYERRECECGSFRMRALPPGPPSLMISA